MGSLQPIGPPQPTEIAAADGTAAAHVLAAARGISPVRRGQWDRRRLCDRHGAAAGWHPSGPPPPMRSPQRRSQVASPPPVGSSLSMGLPKSERDRCVLSPVDSLALAGSWRCADLGAGRSSARGAVAVGRGGALSPAAHVRGCCLLAAFGGGPGGVRGAEKGVSGTTPDQNSIFGKFWRSLVAEGRTR